jgi:hypothetical protein
MHTGTGTLPPYFLPFFLVFFFAVWVLSCQLISRASGWHSLARRFSQQSEPYGETRSAGPWFYGVYARYWIHYNSVVRITASDSALYLSMLFPFRAGHPPLCIPWQEIEVSRTRYFLRRYVVLMLGTEERIPLRITERMAGKLGILERIPEAETMPQA